MELSELIFTAKTDDLERVSKVIGGLVTDISKLDKASRDAAKTEATLARAAKDNAKANLDNAKAQDTLAKTMLNVDKAANAATAATEKKAKATEKATEATARQTSVLQKQKDILEFQTQGFSKGQAGILAYGKAAGLAANDIEELGKVLETQRKLMGGDPFDKSLSGLKSLQNQYTELKESVRQYATDSNLSAKQTRELARDKERLIEKMKVEGASFSDIRKAVRAHNDEYVKLATQYNNATSAEDAVIKSRREAISATNYLTQADQKMAAALNQSNASLDKAGTDSLVKYETALRKSGVSQDVATAKLAAYKAQLTQVNTLEQKRREQHLARALSPQLTDIGVSLYSGQAPLTVLLQQGGQISDLLRLSGVEAKNFGKALRDAFGSMIPVMATVAQGLGQFAFGLFQEAGAGVTNFVGKITGINAAMEIAKRAIVSGGEANFKYIASLDKMGRAFSTVAATGVAALIAGLILLALEYKKIIQLESELSVALATSGGALGITKDQAVATAQSMESLGIGTLKAVGAISEIAKAGNIGKESLELVTKAAIDLEKTAGVGIEETAKQYAKLQEEPAKALTDIAQKTGLVDKATLEYVYSLEQQGDKAEAARVATLALASAHAQVASEIRDNWSPIEALWNDIKSAIGRVKQEIYDLTTSNAVVSALRTVWEAVSVTISEVWFTIKGVGKEIGGIGAQIAAVMRGDFSQAAEIGKQMKIDAVAARQAQDEFTASLMDRSKQETKFFNQSKEQNSEYAKWRRENARSIEEGISKEDRYKAKQLEIQKAVLAGTITQIEADKSLAGWKKIIFGGSNKSENYYATLMREATNNTIAANTATQELTKSEQKLLEVKADPRFAKLTATQQADVIAKYDAAIAAERQTAMTEKLAEAEEHRLKLLGKSEGIGKQYYADMQKLEEFAKVAGWSREEIEELTRAVFQQTPAWKAYEKALEDVNTASRKFQEDSLASQASVLQENQSLDHRLSLLGKTAEEQKAITIEYQRANKIREVDIKLARQLREIEEKIAEAKKKGLPESDYKSLIDAEIQARKDAAEQHKVINREVAVQYAEDMQREIDAIKSGISDSIVTALFEGGKAGSKKLRDLVINELKKPVTLVVNAVINTLLGSVMGSLFGAAASSAVGSAGSSLLGSAAASAGGSLLAGATGIGTGTSLMGGFSGSILPAGMVGPSVAAPTLMSGLGNALSAIPGWGWILAGAALFGKKLFGRTLKDTGIQGTFGGESGFQGESYRYYRGGLFRSDKTTTEALDEGTRKQLGDAFIAMRNQVTDFAKILGLNTDKLKGFTSSIKISLSGLKDNEIEAKLQEALATANNELAQQVIGTWETTTSTVSRQIRSTFMETEAGAEAYRTVEETITESTYVASEYAREGEKAIDTLTRLATSLSTVNSVFENLGVTLFQSSLAGADLASALVDAFGGIEAFISATSYFYDNFYSDTEKFVNQQRQLTSVFNQFGVALPQSKEEFRKLLESIDLTTDSGREMYAALMKIAPGFVQFIELTGQLGATIDDSAEAARRAAEEARQNALSNLDKALSNLRSAINAEKSSINEDLNAAKQVHSKIKSVFDTLSKAIENLYQQATDPVMAAEQGNAFISAALKAAQATGDLPDNEELQKAIAAATGGFGIENYSSLAERRYAQLKLAGELEKLKTLTGDQLSDSEHQIELLEDQLEILDDTLKYWEQQVEAAKGGIEAVMSVESAIVAMQVALQTVLEDGFGAIVEGGGLGGGSLLDLLEELAKQYSPNTPKEALEQLVKSISEGVITKGQGLNLLTGTPTKSGAYHQTVDIEGISELDFYQGIRTNTDTLIAAGWTADALAKAMIEGGVSLTDMAKAYGITAAEIAANLLKGGATVLPQLAVGTNYLPDDMVIQAHKGERIIPKADNEQLMRYISGGGSSNATDNSALITEIRALRVQNERLEARLNAIQQNTKVTSDLLDQVTEGGNAMRTSAI